MGQGSVSSRSFAAAHAVGEEGTAGRSLAEDCLRVLPKLRGSPSVGFLYASDLLAADYGEIIEYLRAETGIAAWTGTVGLGVIANGREFYGEPALSLMVGSLPPEDFALLPPRSENGEQSLSGQGITGQGLLAESRGSSVQAGNGPAGGSPAAALSRSTLGVVHGDPENPQVPRLLQELARETSSFLVGGLTSSRGGNPQAAGQVTSGGLSGLFLGGGCEAVVGLSQGCSPLGPPHHVTAGSGTKVMGLDGQPALRVLLEDIGELIEADPRRLGNVHVAFPVADSDTGDYFVRNLLGIDQEEGSLEVGELVAPGSRLTFCRRDREAAERDLHRMLADVKRRAGRQPQAALYYSCLARGRHLFGPGSREAAMVREYLGEVPLAGFFANGEISNERLYAYTAVLAVLL